MVATIRSFAMFKSNTRESGTQIWWLVTFRILRLVLLDKPAYEKLAGEKWDLNFKYQIYKK